MGTGKWVTWVITEHKDITFKIKVAKEYSCC